MVKRVQKKVEPSLTHYQRLLAALVLSNFVSVLFFLLRVTQAQNIRYWFLLWNLLLAWVPLGAVLLLRERLQQTRWFTWQNILLSAVWLGFLPNSFYIASDLIHLYETGEVSLLFDSIMFMSFIFNGFTAGFASIYVLHMLLLKRFVARNVHAFIGIIFVLCSFAVYLGRELRWNTWDILVNPAGILFDVSERVINPLTHPESFSITALFFVFISSIYIVIWQFIISLRDTDS